MILTIDIGNTNIAIGGFEGNEPRFVARLATDTAKTSDEYAAAIVNVLAIHHMDKEPIEGAILSSVVPPLNAVMKQAVRFLSGAEPLTVGPGIKTGLIVHCDDPASVGADLICACVAVRTLYGCPALIVDLGTATKIMMVDKRGAFVGVAIAPGVGMGLKALASGTAQLPQVSLDTPPRAIGKNTADSMRAGLLLGHAAMIDGMIDRLCEEANEPLPVYATGGMASAVVGHCKREILQDEHLVLKGLNVLYRKNRP